MSDEGNIESCWSKIAKTKDCWVWEDSYGNRSGAGHMLFNRYGSFYCGWGDGNRQERNWHVFQKAAWKQLIGPVPAGKALLRSCRNKCCVNPTHISVGVKVGRVKKRASKKQL